MVERIIDSALELLSRSETWTDEEINLYHAILASRRVQLSSASGRILAGLIARPHYVKAERFAAKRHDKV